MEKLHPIMFAGTGSDVGKALLPRLSAVFSVRMAIIRHHLRHRIWHLIPMLHLKGWK